MNISSHNHAGNIMAVAAPIALWLTHAAPVITGICGLMGIAWYCVLFVKEFKEWLKK